MNLRFWMRDSVKKNKKFMAILFAVSMLFSLCIVGILSNQRYLAERQHVDTLAEAYISRGNLLIDDMLQNAQLLKLLLLRQNGDTRNFNEFARNILSRQEVIEGIADQYLATTGLTAIGMVMDSDDGARRLPENVTAGETDL